MTMDLSLPVPPGLPADPSAVQARASDPQSSVWVNASAGTGKTKVLTDRVLRLLLAGTPPQRLLCLTFTKAAAAEMANRVQEKLAHWVTAPPVELDAALAKLTGDAVTDALVARARRLFASVVDCPGGLKIQTIHAFGQSLLRRFPVEAGVPPQFEVMEDATAAATLQRALEETVTDRALERPALADAVAVLARLLPVDDFTRLLQALVAERSRLRRLFDAKGGLDGVLAQLDTELRIAPGETRATRLAAFCRDDTLDGLHRAGLDVAAEALLAGSATDSQRGACLKAFLTLAEAARPDGWEDYCRAFLTAEGEPRKTLITKPTAKAHPDAEPALVREQERVADAVASLLAFVTRDCSAAALTVADEVLRSYAAHKAQAAQLDFDDIVLKVRDLLQQKGGPSWVLYKLDGGLDHILVDEAQDTNPDQWEIVAALTEEFFGQEGARLDGRTLFVVGDEKQSIYSFQRADPEKFKAMRAHFERVISVRDGAWAAVPLQTSFRSTRPVLALVDAVFALEQHRAGVSDDAIAHASFRLGEAGHVELWPLANVPAEDPAAPEGTPKPGSRDAQRRLAERLAAEIARWIREGEPLPAKGRAIRPGDIMILMRSRNALVAELLRALSAQGVPVAGRDRMVLTAELAVQDLIAFARFLLLPDDDLSLACLLKTPLCGLDDDDLFRLAYGRSGTLWQALRAAAAGEGAELRFVTVAAWLDGWLARTDLLRPFELLAAVLSQPCPGDAVSGRRALVGRLGHSALDPLAELLSAALGFQSQAIPTLEAFLHWLTRLQADVKREQEQASDGPGFVRIMTVHGSKGLQAPIVILPDTMSDAVRAGERLFFPASPDSPPRLVASSADSDRGTRAIREAWAEKQEQEHRRLLYVALTRAEDRLIVCGAAGLRAARDDKPTWYNMVAAGFRGLDGVEREDAAARLELEGEVLLHRSGQAQPARAPAVPPATGPAAPLPGWARGTAPEEPEPHRPLAPSRPDAPEPAMASPWPRASLLAFRRGRLVHTLLQVLPDCPADARAAVAAAYLAQPGHGLSGAEQAELAAEALAVLGHPALAGVFEAGGLPEVPIAGTVQLGGRPRTVTGQIDRLLLTPERTLLVDFKTTRPPPAQVDKVPRSILQQLAAYRALLERMRPGVPVETVLVWTFAARVMPVPASLLDSAFA